MLSAFAHTVWPSVFRHVTSSSDDFYVTDVAVERGFSRRCGSDRSGLKSNADILRHAVADGLVTAAVFAFSAKFYDAAG